MADAIVIGGGVIGLLCARELRQRGLSVTLLERDRPGRQASWAAAGILSVSPPSDTSPEARLKNLSERLYPDLVRTLREESGMDPELTWNGHLIPAFSTAGIELLRTEAAEDERLGLKSEIVEGVPLRKAEPALGPTILAGRLLPGGQVDNRRLCRALDLANRLLGVDQVFGAAVLEVQREGDRVTGVRTLEGDFSAAVVVNAAGSWSGALPGSEPHVPVAPQRGEILALDQGAIGLCHVISKPDDPYLVPRADGRLIVGATRKYVGYDSSFTAGGLAWLLNEAIAMVPGLAEAPVVETWTGFRPNSGDGLPMIGRGAIQGLFYATGHGPSGIAPAPATARLLAALVTGEEPPIPPAPYDPLRFSGVQIPVDTRTWGERGGTGV